MDFITFLFWVQGICVGLMFLTFCWLCYQHTQIVKGSRESDKAVDKICKAADELATVLEAEVLK